MAVSSANSVFNYTATTRHVSLNNAVVVVSIEIIFWEKICIDISQLTLKFQLHKPKTEGCRGILRDNYTTTTRPLAT
jgi:hypothetical protein